MIKKMIKGEKGFTLVELLAVIVILGIIVAIAIPAIGNVIEKAGSDADDAEESLIIDAARLYEMQHDGTPGPGGSDTGTGNLPVTVEQLKNAGYIEERQGTELPSGTISRNAAGELTFTPAGGADGTDGTDGTD